MSNKYWTDKTDGVDVASAKDLNKAFDGIAEDLSNVNVEVDDTPTQGSDKPVSSNGVYIALENKQDKGAVPDNVVTTDMANKTNGYAALDNNKGIEVNKIVIPCEHPFYQPEGETKLNVTISETGIQSESIKPFGITSYYGYGLIFPAYPKYIETTEQGILGIRCKGENEALEIVQFDLYRQDPFGSRDEDISHWVTDNDIKNKSVVSVVHNNHKNIKTLTTELDEKQDKAARKYDDFSAVKTVSMNNNTEFPYLGQGVFTELTLDFAPAGSLDYYSYITFESGSTPTVFATTDSSGEGTTIVLKGEDCDASGAFTPVANKKYEIAFRCVGFGDATFYIVGRVGSC